MCFQNIHSPSESSGNGSGTTLHTWEQRVQNSLACEEREVGSLLLGDWSRSSNGPQLHHGVFLFLSLEFGLQDDIL